MALIITYDKLKQVLTEDEGFQYIKQLAKTFKFPATSFLSGSIGYTLLKVQGAILAIISDSVSSISKQIYLDESTGSFLTLLAANFFDVMRSGESQTIIEPRIVTAGSTPMTYDAESVKIKIGNIEFYNSETFSVVADGYIDVEFTSTEFGADTRVGVSTLPIFSENIISNATFELISNEDGYFKLISNGQDEESDEFLRERCRAKWGTLSTLGPESAYRNWIMTAVNSNTQEKVDITRIKIDRSDAQTIGKLIIYCAGATGTASAEDIAFANAVVQRYRSINADVYLDPAVERVFNYALDVTVNSSAEQNYELMMNSIRDCIKSYFETIDIGGVILNKDDDGYVVFSKIVDLIMELPGVENVVCTGLTVDDVPQTKNDVQIRVFDVPTIVDDDQYGVINLVRI